MHSGKLDKSSLPCARTESAVTTCGMCSVSSSKTPERNGTAGSSGESRALGDIRTGGDKAGHG